jgi:predicted O-methyltransferase YrrM
MGSTLWLALTLVLLVLTICGFLLFARYRRRLHQATGRFAGPIPSVPLAEFDEMFERNDLGPTLRSEIAFIGSGDGVPYATSDSEAWILAVCAKRAVRMFEFGTATGRTAYLWARNSSPEATVTTLTLAPDQVDLYRTGGNDDDRATDTARRESSFTRFLYSGTPVESKIEQLFLDSKTLDVGPYAGRCDLIFVDGSHAYSYVRSDTEKALAMLEEGGLILWHDYRGPHGETRGVYDYLNELSRRLPLVRLANTSLVAYRKGMRE